MNNQLNNRPILHDLGDGLIFCRYTAGEADNLTEFNAHIHSLPCEWEPAGATCLQNLIPPSFVMRVNNLIRCLSRPGN